MEQRRGPRSAFFAEYDAPSELGHACGHNLIATSVMFASIATRRAMAEFGVAGSIEVFGKSAEEDGGGKTPHARKGSIRWPRRCLPHASHERDDASWQLLRTGDNACS